MNPKPIIGLLLVTNVVLLGAVLYLGTKRIEPRVAVTESPARTASEPKDTSAKAAPSGSTNVVASQKFDWQSVESADYKEYIANLRAIGCPEETIRDIILADVKKLFDARRKALGGGKKSEFWKSGNMLAGLVDEEKAKQNQTLAEERKALLQELLGFVPPESASDIAMAGNPLAGVLDFLPEEKQASIMAILQEHQAKGMKAIKGGAPDAEDMKALLKVQKDMDAALAATLTPEEFEDYQLRLSQTSMMMRMQLGAFEPSEQEFRELFKVRKAFDDEFGWGGAMASDPKERERIEAAKKQSDGQIKQMLGEQRYAEYERSQDFQYQSLVKIGDRNELPRETVNQAYDIEKMSRETIQKLHQDQSLDAEKRQTAVKEIRSETDSTLRTLLGEKAFDSFTNRNFRPGR